MTAPATGWEDHGTAMRLWIDIPLRKNGLPNIAAARAVEAYFATFNPDAFDPIEPVPESVAKAAMRDNVVTHVEMTADDPPLPDFNLKLRVPELDDEEIPGYRCANGACVGD